MSGYYSISVAARARELRNAGWTIARTQDFVERETGRRPSRSRIYEWAQPVDPSTARTERRNSKRSALSSGRLTSGPRRRPEFKAARVRALFRDVGLGAAAIAALMSWEFGDPLTAGSVRRIVAGDPYPASFDGRGAKAAA